VNEYRGETEVRIGPRVLKLSLKTHAWAYLKTALHDLGREYIFDEKGVIRADAGTVVAVLWACIAAPHDVAPFTRAQIATMIDDAGGVDEFGRIKDPELISSWAKLLVNAKVMDRESAEAAGFIPGARKPDPKGEAAPNAAEAQEAARTVETAST
jgi:hypothetical protein